MPWPDQRTVIKRIPPVLGGCLPRKLSFFQFFDGRIGLDVNPPPQLGQTLSRASQAKDFWGFE